MRRVISIVGVALFSLQAVSLTGCSETLETGYAPRKLGSSNETRRGFYAQPFSPESRRAREYEQDFGSPSGRYTPGK